MGDLDTVFKRRHQARVLDVGRERTGVCIRLSPTPKRAPTSPDTACAQREVRAPYVLLWTAGDDRAAGDARGHCARRVERALPVGAEYARSFAPRSGPQPDLQFHVRDEADDAHDDIVLPILVRAGLGRGLGVVDCVVGSVALLWFGLL